MANVNFPIQTSQKVAAMWPGLHALVDEGSLFLMSSTDAATGKAAGTAIATTTSVVDDAATASATHAQNVPVMYLSNNSSRTDPAAPVIYPIALRMLLTQVPTSATEWRWAMRADNVSRYTSGGTRMNAINLNTGSSKTSTALCYFGAVVTALASANQRVLGSGQVEGAIPVTRAQWIFTFGDMTMPSSIATTTGLKNINVPCNPFALAAGWNFTLEMWGASNAAATSWEFDFIYAEREPGL